MTTRSVASLGVFIALVTALGFALSGVPNVELMSLMTFVSGAVLGPRKGAVVGAVSMGLYSGFNPYGPALPPTFAMQVLGAAGIGVVGGLAVLGRWFERTPPGLRWPLGAALGLVLTLFYDALTNLGTAWSIGAYLDPWPILVGGITFAVWHIVWNGAFFGVGLPPMLAVLTRRRERGQ